MQKTSEEATEATETDKTIEDAATVTEPVKEEGTAKETEPAKANSKKKAIIIAAVVVALVVCGLLAWFLVDQHNRQVWEQEHKAYPVNLTLVAEGYDSSTSTPIPVQIEGTDFEGNSVSTETLVGSNGAEPISLMRGNYTLSVTASPISEDGTMFDVSESASEFEVVGDSNEGEGQGRATITFSPIAVEAMTEDLVNASAEKLVELGYSQEEITKFTDAALTKIKDYQDKVAAQKAAEEAAKKAAEEAAKRHISTDWYEFDIPQQWVGKVDWSIDGDSKK